MRHIPRFLWMLKREQRSRNKSRRQRKAAQNPEMGQDLFRNLPSDITMNILLRLPIRAAMSCKCVCKSLLNLLTTPEFVKSHLSKSVPGLVVYESETLLRPYKVIEFVDELDLNSSVRHWNIVFNFNFPYSFPVFSSVNGLIVLCRRDYIPCPDLYIYNPVTREYIMPPSPSKSSYKAHHHQLDTYGFGVSRISGQYKLVRIFYEFNIETADFLNLDKSQCQVYTVGTGKWRTIASASPRVYGFDCVAGAFLNGNLHWVAVVHDLTGVSTRISCFDLEMERFCIFSAPDREGRRNLSTLQGCLCLCDNRDGEIVIWLMKGYGDENSWTKEFIIRKMEMSLGSGILWPIKVFEDGDILMELMETCNNLFYYSNKNKTIQELHHVDWDHRYSAAIYTPTFVSLKTFPLENVISF